MCELPLTGPGSHGEVLAELPSSGGASRKSNGRPLTEWLFTLHYRWPSPYGVAGFLFEGTGTLRFRGDADSTRDAPGTTPTLPLRGLDPTDDSSITVTGSGVSGGCLQLSGSGTFKAYSARPAGGSITSDLPFLSEVTTSNCNANGPRGAVAPVIGLLDGTENVPSALDDGQSSPPLSALRTTLDAQFRVGLRQYEDPLLHEALDWSDLTPLSPITAETLR